MTIEIKEVSLDDTESVNLYKKKRDLLLFESMGVAKCYYDDPHGTIICAYEDDKLVGGVRLDCGYLDSKSIPIEKLGYNVSNYLNLPKNTLLFQLTGLIADNSTNFLRSDIVEMLIACATLYAIVNKRCQLQIVHAGMVNSRLYRRMCRKMGLTLDIHSNLHLPKVRGFEDHVLVLSTMELTEYEQLIDYIKKDTRFHLNLELAHCTYV